MIRLDFNKNTFPHWTELPIRFRDLDPLNHVNNAIFSTYYEEARIIFIREVPSFANQMENGFSFVLANITIDFISPVEYPANILIGSGIKKIGNTSITSFQAVYTAESKKLVSVAEARGVWFDLDNQRPSPVPELPEKNQFLLSNHLFE